MKQLSNDDLEALEIIRPRIQDKNVMLSKAEFLALKVLYENINHVFNNIKITISESCSACIPSAMKIVSNYIEYHYQPIVKKPQIEAEVVVVDTKLTVQQLKDICKSKGIKYHHKAKEAKLIQLINSHKS